MIQQSVVKVIPADTGARGRSLRCEFRDEFPIRLRMRALISTTMISFRLESTFTEGC